MVGNAGRAVPSSASNPATLNDFGFYDDACDTATGVFLGERDRLVRARGGRVAGEGSEKHSVTRAFARFDQFVAFWYNPMKNKHEIINFRIVASGLLPDKCAGCVRRM